MIRRPAVLGGTPAFPDGLRLLKPTLPPYDQVGERWKECFGTGALTKGRWLAEYERNLAQHLGVRHAIAVSSCTAGLMLALDQYRGRTALLPSFTFMATAMAVSWAGLDPVLCDVRPDTWCLDVESVLAAMEARQIAPDEAVVMPVHVFGNPADTDVFDELTRRTGVPVLYDSAHGFGALRDGAPVGAQGTAQVFSTSPTKLLITGEGGVVATDDDATAEHVIIGREYGNPGDYDALFAGINARMPEASALLGIASLDLLEGEARRRNELAAVYREALAGLPGLTFQTIRPQDRCSYKDFSLTIGPDFGLSRDEVALMLDREGIPTRAYYVPAVHEMTAFAGLADEFEDGLPVTLRLTREIVSLPIYGSLDESEIELIAGCMRAGHEHAFKVRTTLSAI